MKHVQAWMLIAALGAGAAMAQTETQPRDTEQQGSQQGSQAPATDQTEGTAADSTPPGQTGQTGTGSSNTGKTADPTTVDPRPSTDPAEGTAADSTPPGETEMKGESETTSAGTTRTAAAGGAKADSRRVSKLMGMSVQDRSGSSVGKVADVVLDSDGRVTHLVIDRAAMSGGQGLVALPWSAASGMMKGGNLVVDPKQLERAPSFQEQRWPDVTRSDWSAETDRFWAAKGTSR